MGGAQGQNIGIVTQVMSHCSPLVIPQHYPTTTEAKHHHTTHHSQHIETADEGQICEQYRENWVWVKERGIKTVTIFLNHPPPGFCYIFICINPYRSDKHMAD